MRTVGVRYTLPDQIVNVDGLRVQFEVNRQEGDPARAEITVWQLGRELRAKLHKATSVSLTVNGHLVFVGDVRRFEDKYLGTDVALTVEAVDGAIALERRVSGTIGENRTMQDAIDEVLRQAGITDATILVDAAKIKLRHGRVLDAAARDILDSFARTLQAQWSVHDGKLFLRPRDVPVGVVVRLDASSGLVGTPERIDDSVKIENVSGQDPATRRNAWRIRSLLIPSIRPGVQLDVTSRAVRGQMIVRRVRLSGDSRGNEFYADSEAELLQ